MNLNTQLYISENYKIKNHENDVWYKPYVLIYFYYVI